MIITPVSIDQAILCDHHSMRSRLPLNRADRRTIDAPTLAPIRKIRGQWAYQGRRRGAPIFQRSSKAVLNTRHHAGSCAVVFSKRAGLVAQIPVTSLSAIAEDDATVSILTGAFTRMRSDLDGMWWICFNFKARSSFNC
jgi:hypothetical protein